MNIFERTQIGVDIFYEKLIICGYDFKKSDFNNFEQIFKKLKGINNLNIIDKLRDIEELFYTVLKSIGFSFLKPAVFLSVPDELNGNYWDDIRDKISTTILGRGWSKIYYVEELMATSIGSELPYNKLKSDGLYAKSIFIYCKKNSETFAIGCAGGLFEKFVFPNNFVNIDQSTFENIIQTMTRNDFKIPDSFVNRPYPEDDGIGKV